MYRYVSICIECVKLFPISKQTYFETSTVFIEFHQIMCIERKLQLALGMLTYWIC
jgi:hypothetical protein